MRPEVKSTLEKLLDDPGYKAIYDSEGLVIECMESICEAMERKGISNKEMAEKLGLPLHYWKGLLGDNCLNIRMLSLVASALDMKATITLEDK